MPAASTRNVISTDSKLERLATAAPGPPRPGVRAPLGARRYARAGAGAPQATVPPWTKPAPLGLHRTATIDQAIAVIVAACRTHWHANMAAAVDGRDPEGIHQVRVGLRRFRSALTLFKRYIPEAQRTALNQEAKWLLTQLGPARDLDVFVHGLAAPLAERVSDDARLAALMRAARNARAKIQADVVKALKGPRATRFFTRLDAWLAGRGWRIDDGETLRDGNARAAAFGRRAINRRLRKLAAAYGDVGGLTVDERHELRIAAKKIRYGIEFFASVFPAKRAARMGSALKHLQDGLGHLNDLEVADRTIARLTDQARTADVRRKIASGGRVIRQWHAKAAMDATPEAARTWRKVRKLAAV